MERIRQMQRSKAEQVAPEPGENISQPSQEESGPSVPAGGEKAHDQGKERSCVACWRRRKTAAPLADPEAPSGPKWRWPQVQLWRREPGEGRRRGRQLWGFLRRKPRCQELRPRAQQEPSTTCASPTLAQEEPPTSTTLTPEEPPASPEQELSDCATNTSSSVYSCGASSSSVGSGSPEFLGSLFGARVTLCPCLSDAETPTDQSEKDFAPEEKTEEDEDPDTEREEEEEDLKTEEEEKQEEQVLISEKEEEVEELVMKEEENITTEEEEDLDTEEKGEEEISIEENKEEDENLFAEKEEEEEEEEEEENVSAEKEEEEEGGMCLKRRKRRI
ncbi:hypothetical protein KIL84_015603 [Mauremys mutica]|uniref:Uncharacterized protein n=1 Tax=Mauremys mutica TaxID=74926 RepID=A0A9D3WR33_9SAUR|nr:hypothetical protein KIL84_015603 [Mauremys mutica]